MTETIISQGQIVQTAFLLAGAGASEDQVAAEVTRILIGVGEGSPILYAFTQVAKREENVEGTKTILGTIIHADVEETSQRGVIFLKSETSHPQFNPLGKENVRTNRIDDDKSGGKALLNGAVGLIGHKVALTVQVEKTASNKVRVVTRISDRGVDENYVKGSADATPDLSKVTVSKLKFCGDPARLPVAS